MCHRRDAGQRDVRRRPVGPGPVAPSVPRPRWARAYIGVAYFFTSFANPAITIGRMFSDFLAGIAPSVPAFVGTQLLGAALAVLLVRMLYPDLAADQAENVVVPSVHQDARR